MEPFAETSIPPFPSWVGSLTEEVAHQIPQLQSDILYDLLQMW